MRPRSIHAEVGQSRKSRLLGAFVKKREARDPDWQNGPCYVMPVDMSLLGNITQSSQLQSDKNDHKSTWPPSEEWVHRGRPSLNPVPGFVASLVPLVQIEYKVLQGFC